MNNWYYAQGGQKIGPLTLEAIQRLAAEGKIAASDLVWSPGLSNWQRADSQPWFGGTTSTSAPTILPPEGTAEPPAPAPGPQWGNLFKGEAYVPTAPPSLLGWSIAVILCCCLPGGIIGIVYDSKAKAAFAAGRHSDAQSYYEIGKNWLIGSAVAGVVLSILFTALRATR